MQEDTELKLSNIVESTANTIVNYNVDTAMDLSEIIC